MLDLDMSNSDLDLTPPRSTHHSGLAMGQDKPPQYSDTSSTTHYTPKFSDEQRVFLGVTHQFASVKPLGLRIFLNLVQEDDQLFSKDFPKVPKEALEEQLDSILTDSMLKPIVSAHLAKRDYSGALISVTTIIAVTLLGEELHDRKDEQDHASFIAHDSSSTATATDSGQEKSPSEPPGDQSDNQCAPKFSAEQKSFLDVACHFAAVKPLRLKTFLNIISDDEELLSKEFPDRSMEDLTAELDDVPTNPTFKAILSSYLARQDYAASLISIMTLLAISVPNASSRQTSRNYRGRYGGKRSSNRPRLKPFSSRHLDSESFQHGVSLEMLDDPYSQGLYHLYDLLWNRQEDITTSQTVMVPNLPHGYINFEQSAPTAILPPTFGMRPEAYSYDYLALPEDSEAILPANEKSLKKILIRPCYRGIFEALNTDGSHAIVLGHPGTGKSCLLTYILTERLRRQQATLLQLDEDDVYSFTEDGAMRFSPKLGIDHTVLQNAWLLVDCSEYMKSLPQVLSSVYRCSSLKVVLAASPKDDRHKAWRIRVEANEIWTGACPWEEIYVMGCTEFNEPPVQDEKLSFAYLKYGGNPRVCKRVALSASQDVIQLNYIQDEMETHPKSGFLAAAKASQALHTIVPPLDSRSVYTVIPSSPYLARRLEGGAHGNVYRALFNSQRRIIVSVPGLFESWALIKLSDYIQYQTPDPISPSSPLNSSMNYRRLEQFVDLDSFKKHLSTNEAYSTLFIPSCTFPVDAVYLDYNNYTYWLILVSVGGKRVVDGKGMEELPEFYYNSKYTWKFLFIVPKGFDVVEKIELDIVGVDVSSGKLKDIPRYFLQV